MYVVSFFLSQMWSVLFPWNWHISWKLRRLEDDSFPFGGNLGLFSVAFWLVLGDRTTVDIRNSFSFTPFCLPSLRLDWTHPSRVSTFFFPKTELQPWDWRSPRLTYISPRLGTRNTCAMKKIPKLQQNNSQIMPNLRCHLSPLGNSMALLKGFKPRWVHIIPLV